jgi:hypothetical protein
MAVQALKFETTQKVYVETHERIKQAVETINTSALLEDLAKSVQTLSKNKFQMMRFEPRESQMQLAKLDQMQREITALTRDLQSVESITAKDKRSVLELYLENTKQLSGKISCLKTKIEELSGILSVYRAISPQSHSYSLVDVFTPSQSPAASTTLNDLMALDIGVMTTTKNPITKSRSDPILTLADDRDSSHILLPHSEDSDDDGYLEEIPQRVLTTHLTPYRAKKSISYETGLGNLLSDQDHFDVDNTKFSSYFEADAGETISIHVDYIQARATLFTDKSPRDLSYEALNHQLIMTCGHAGQFLHKVTLMTPLQLQAQGLDRISLFDTLQTLINALRTMRDGGIRSIDVPKDPLQAKLHRPFITRDCQRIDRIIQRMTEKMRDTELALIPFTTYIDSGTGLIFPNVILRLIMCYLTELV